MKKILTGVLLFISCIVWAQTDPVKTQPNPVVPTALTPPPEPSPPPPAPVPAPAPSPDPLPPSSPPPSPLPPPPPPLPPSETKPETIPVIPPPAIQTAPPPVSPSQAESVNIEILLDASGSMSALVGPESQIDIAKKAIKQTLSTIPANVPVALRAFAHRVPKTDKEASCKDTELLVPFQPVNVSLLTSAVDAVKPNGYTPLAHALRTAANDFLGKESQYVIILLSDGEETCGGDPVAEAKNLSAQGFKVIIHTIGFRVDEKSRAQLAALSGAMGGSYYDATDTASLTQNLSLAAQKALLIAKPRAAEEERGQEIRGGNQYQDAVALKSNIEYRLDHHQRKNEYDYFYVDLKRSQSLAVTIATTDHGVNIAPAASQAQETNHPYAGFRLHDSTFQQVGSGEVIGKQHGKETRTMVARKDERFYVLMGSSYDSMHKNSPFMIVVKDHFDAASGGDAGDAIENPLEIAVQNYPENWLFEDDSDYFRLNVQGGQVYSLAATPQSMSVNLALEVWDEDRIRLGYKSAPNAGAATRFENIVPKKDGVIFFRVHGYGIHDKPESYALTVGAMPAADVPPAETRVTSPPLMPLPEEKKGLAPQVVKGKEPEAGRDHGRFIFTLKVLAISIAINLILAGVIFWLVKKGKK